VAHPPDPGSSSGVRAALLLIDVINDLEFEGGDALLAEALPMAGRIAELKRRAGRRGIPTIYVNDNFGRWRSDFRRTVEHVLEDGVRGEPVARLLAPQEIDYFVLKPMHSGFYQTTLEALLQHLGIGTLILTGMAVDYCVLFTANDAFMRGYGLCVPTDCVAAESRDVREQVIALIGRVLKADVRPSEQLDLDRLAREGTEAGRASTSNLGGPAARYG
jgi:nicotinamidase-related amidase